MENNKCQFCGNETDLPWMYISMTLPIPRMEDLIDKWGREDWFKNLDKDPKEFSPKESQELEEMCLYDQLLNTVGRGYECKKCMELEDELLQKYYPNEETPIHSPNPPHLTMEDINQDEDDLPF